MFSPRPSIGARAGTALAVALFTFLVHVTTAHAQSPFVMDGDPDFSLGQSIPDPFGNAQELGPDQGADTKISPINTAALAMLGFVPTTGKVDLRRVWVETAQAIDGDTWLYYAWERDANSGSGFVGLEFLQDELDSACNYDGVNFTKPSGNTPVDATTQALIDHCNPWRNRKDGDFFITWDQQGNTLNAANDIKKRVFDCTGSSVPYTCVLGPIQNLVTVQAAISNTRFFGEMAINLTEDVFAGNEACTTIANIIPNTVTGNSDSADYNDTVFFESPDISNCGILKITKVLKDAAGGVISDPDDPATEFEYTVDREDGTDLRYAADGYTTLHQIVTTIAGGETDTHIDLIAGTNYQLVETANATDNWDLQSIICYDGTNMVNGMDEGVDITEGGTYSVVVPNGIAFTSCVITNVFLKTTPSATSTQLAKIFDYVVIDDITPGASNQGGARVTIYLFPTNDASCSGTPLGSTGALTPSYVDSGGSGQKKILVNTSDSLISPATGNSFGSPSGSWKWALSYTGDAFNNAITVTQSCGWELGSVSFSEPGIP